MVLNNNQIEKKIKLSHCYKKCLNCRYSYWVPNFGPSELRCGIIEVEDWYEWDKHLPVGEDRVCDEWKEKRKKEE